MPLNIRRRLRRISLSFLIRLKSAANIEKYTKGFRIGNDMVDYFADLTASVKHYSIVLLQPYSFNELAWSRLQLFGGIDSDQCNRLCDITAARNKYTWFQETPWKAG
jgi:hypothetical protein